MQNKLQLDFHGAGVRFCIALIGCFSLIAPFSVAKNFGHGWGLFVAWLALIGDGIVWLYWGLTRPMTLPTRIIWLLGLLMLVVIGAFVLTHLPH